MAFRASEAILQGADRAVRYLTPTDGSSEQKAMARVRIAELIEAYGPVVDSYPVWHPLVDLPNAKHWAGNWPVTSPSEAIGYHGLDHTILLAGAIITCPYSHAKNKVFEAVEALNHPDGSYHVEEIDTPLYNLGATPILISFEWDCCIQVNKNIPSSVAIPKMLLKELLNWKTAECQETWEDMKHYLMGAPCGSRSSLFVSQETGQAMKSIWNSLLKHGVFIPPKN